MYKTNGYGEGMNCYVCASVWCEKRRENNEIITQTLRNAGINVFLPQEINPLFDHSEEHTKYSLAISMEDLVAIQEAHFGILIIPHGEDSAHEAGYFAGLGKPIIAIALEYDPKWFEYWMIKTTVSAVLTTDMEMFEKLKKDPILSKRPGSVSYIPNIDDLPEILQGAIGNVSEELGREYSRSIKKMKGKLTDLATNRKVKRG